jgi:NADH-quinone oxidoreductase subunit N
VACGFYYYLKVVRAMYWQPATKNPTPIPISGLSRAAMIVLMIGIIWLGVYPRPVLDALHRKGQPAMSIASQQH